MKRAEIMDHKLRTMVQANFDVRPLLAFIIPLAYAHGLQLIARKETAFIPYLTKMIIQQQRVNAEHQTEAAIA